MTFSHLFGRLCAIGIACLVVAFPGMASAAGPGSDVCKGCHEPYFDSYAKSVHGVKGNLKGPANAGECSSCHGDGTKHVEAGGGRGAGGIINPNNPAISADQRNAACLSCHESNRALAFWDSGRHKLNDVTCSNCHSIHGTPKGFNEKLVKANGPTPSPYVNTVRQLQYETCNQCHKEQRSQILKPSHHPIVEGKVKCSDCHNPHGSLSPAMIKNDTVNDLCTTCHADKRGPYIAEHPPVSENCLNCHLTHGSNHNKLLTERLPNLCQDCHQGASHLGTIWNQKDTFVGGGGYNAPPPGTVAPTILANGPRFIGRSCLNCHTNIHGSNAPGSPGQRFRQ